MRPLEQTHWGDRRQDPRQFGHLRNIRLPKERAAFRIETAGQKIERDTAAVFAQHLRITHAGERVIIGDDIERLTLGLQLDCRPHHAEIIADVEHAAGLNAGKNAHVDVMFCSGGLRPSHYLIRFDRRS